jgi:tetratricopeptide (TPR) repeat protein
VSGRNLYRLFSGGLAIAASFLLVAGCNSTGTKPDAQTEARAHKRSAKRIPTKSFGPELRADKTASAHAHYLAGYVYDTGGDSESALKEYLLASEDAPHDEELALKVSRRLLEAKQTDKAWQILKQASANPGASGELYAALGVVSSQLGKTNEAVVANQTAIKRSPTSLAGYQSLFLFYVQKKQNEQALQVLDQAARQQNVSAEFLVTLSELYAALATQVPAQKDALKKKQVAVLDRAGKLNPAEPSLKFQIAEAYNSLGEYDKAGIFYRDLLKKMPDIPLIRERVHARLTEIYMRSSDKKRATEQLEALAKEDPTNPQVHYFLGALALDDKRPKDAVDSLRRAIILNPSLEPAYYDLAMAQLGTHDTTNALETLREAKKKFAPNFLMEFWLAMANAAIKDFGEAIQHYTAAEIIAKATDPRRLNEFFYFQFGAACERKGNYSDAERNFEKAIQLKPDFSEALNYLGFMWAEHGTNLSRAQEYIEKALKTEPKNAAFLDSLGWVYYKQNKPAEALTYVKQAADLTEEPDPTLFDHLGDIYAALNQTDKAREMWQKSLDLDAKAEVKKKLESNPGK